jgi:arginyl-tRNA synthetase
MSIQTELKNLLSQAIARCAAEGLLPQSDVAVSLERPRRPEHGDFACNVALGLAKTAKAKPRDLAQAIVDHLVDPEQILEKVEIAGPGFINLKFSPRIWQRTLGQIVGAGNDWGQAPARTSPRILIEFVSANPTGPLHVGHGRGAVAGDTLARLLRKAGYPVTTEYYLNDAGSQVMKLARSIQFRALELLAQQDPTRAAPTFPEDGYPGDYVIDIARRYLADRGEMPAGDLTAEQLETIRAYGVGQMKDWIASTLGRMGIAFDVWSSEKALHDAGELTDAVNLLRASGHAFDQDGAIWFRSTGFGDEKDRVIVRDTGEPTYFAADIAYHLDKYCRGFDHLINIWGADHHGYIPRMKGSVAALGRSPDSLEVLLVQFVALVKGGEKLQQGKRLGQFVTVDDVLDAVGPDVTRYFFVERKFDAHVDFDLDVALSEDPRVNPAKYAQYGHARACSILDKARRELGVEVPAFEPALAARLTSADEIDLLRRLADFPDLVVESAEAREPHRIVSYLHEVSRAFQSWYTRSRKDSDPILPPASQRTPGWETRWDVEKMKARLMWVEAIRIVCRNALTLLGLATPELMPRLDEVEAAGGSDA